MKNNCKSLMFISIVSLMLCFAGSTVNSQQSDFTKWDKMKLGKFRDCALEKTAVVLGSSVEIL
jgi:hypothetical protein